MKNRKRVKPKFDQSTENAFLGYDGNSTAYQLQENETRQLTRARNVGFNGKRVVGFINVRREDENEDLLFDATFDD